ncbi:OsmC family protein [Pengzhenrongella sicca]|uniref:OsmC family protein n=1 Tax=Pengzhenrongella sicca TaxID=2819238 RepID=A0A8A4ZD68_9MICO|nr:OsmC family protein [Pengzhenrongella sicca]QTE28969.1 OsmC family protein [Pengzhenrongella sicca]
MTAEPIPAPIGAPTPTATRVDATPEPARLWVERTGTRTYEGHSSRGGHVLIGPSSELGMFTPGELLKIALAGCSGMTSDAAFARRLGDDYEATIHVEGPKHAQEDRYPRITEELVVDLSGLDPTARERLLAVVERAIEGHCTVARTLAAGAEVELTIAGER